MRKKNCIGLFEHKNAIIKCRYITPSRLQTKIHLLPVSICLISVTDYKLCSSASLELSIKFVVSVVDVSLLCALNNRIVLFYFMGEVFVYAWNKLYWHRIDVDFQFYTFLTRSCASMMDMVASKFFCGNRPFKDFT